MIIRGDRNTGKTSLFNRLQGKPLKLEYEPSDTLKSANINWLFPNSKNFVKIEVWDVVDSQKNSSDQMYDEYEEVDLDTVPVANKSSSGLSSLININSSLVDVMKGTNVVIMIFDPRNISSWEYVKVHLTKIPRNVQVLIMVSLKNNNFI